MAGMARRTGRGRLPVSGAVERLVEIVPEVLGVLDADRDPQRARGNAGDRMTSVHLQFTRVNG